MRESTSRPRWSVPSGCARPSAPARVGAASRARSDWRTGSWGASHGAATATRASRRTNAAPAATRRRVRRATRPPRAASTGAVSAGTDTGIEDAIHELDDEVEGDEEDGRQEHHALHDRIVAVVDRVDGEPADARPREHRFRHHRATEQGPELQAGDREHGNGGGAEGVLRHQAPRAAALAARRAAG